MNVSYPDKWNGDCVGLWNKQTYSRTRDLPGDALVIAFFMHSYFSAKLQQIRMKFLSQSTANNPPIQTQIDIIISINEIQTKLIILSIAKHD